MRHKNSNLRHSDSLLRPSSAVFLVFCCLIAAAVVQSAAATAAKSFHSITPHGGLTDAEAHYIRHRQLLYYRDEFGDRGENVTVDPSLVFENPRIRAAYVALQAWKQAILSDPFNLTADWVGSN
ncbi:hypothetical protein CRG98_028789, partial [Punica granatum]